MRLAIIGSQGKAWYSVPYDAPTTIAMAKITICSALTFLEPEFVISGGCDGVDRWVRNECEERNWMDRYSEHLPHNPRWEPDGYKARNKLIASGCTHLLSIRSRHSKTYGSGWTADYAEKLGKKVWRINL